MSVKYNFFAVQDQPYFLNYQINLSNFDQTLVDWLRDATQEALLNLNGVDVKHLIRSRIGDGEINSGDLFKLFEDEIIAKLNLDLCTPEGTEILQFLMKSLHQGACLHVMQNALCDEAVRSGYEIRGQNVRAHVNISVNKGVIYIQEDVSVSKLFKLMDPETEVSALSGDIDASGNKMPIVFGTVVHKIGLNRSGKVSHDLMSSSIVYGSEQAKKIIDQRSLFQRIRDFFKHLFGVALKVTQQVKGSSIRL